MNLDEKRKTNQLINEKSPYLLQHAYNPVNWYPWCEEAFVKAKSEDKPVFLSIGYSTCHWCHVMEHESFEDEEVANLLNEHFVSIKVDKEENPEIDTIYMSVCQMMNGHGGWPLTIIMTPEQKPFFSGTYLPKHTKGQMFGLMELLNRIVLIWKQDKKRLIESSEEIVKYLQRSESKVDSSSDNGEDDLLEQRVFGAAYFAYQSQFDHDYGGFGNAPKFPTPHNLMYLLRYGVLFHYDSAIEIVTKTLDSMYQGGIYDHIGGGFSRYSTDDQWLVPHFEKMLYDNALLVLTYCEAYQVTKKKLYDMIVHETLNYIAREMTNEEGGFYCAQDADSEGEEGKYYTFTPTEVIQVLGKEDGDFFNAYYQITEQGNFEGASIPNRIDKEIEAIDARLRQLKEKLYSYRMSRMSLHKDDKILTSWNSLMIMAYAKAYQVFHEEQYLFAARAAYTFINTKLRNEDGRLAVRYRDGHRYGYGNLEDYAFFSCAQIMLYETTFDPMYLLGATKDADEMIRLFWDQKSGGFYFYGEDANELILRPKETYDGAIPSGNSVAAYVLSKLEKLTRKDSYREMNQRQQRFLSREMKEYPTAYSFALCAFLLELEDASEIVCVMRDSLDLGDLHQLLRDYFLPISTFVVIEQNSREELKEVAPFTADYKEVLEESEFYICQNYKCNPPIYGLGALKAYLEKDN